jgi:osmotically-inducible protein OsmY
MAAGWTKRDAAPLLHRGSLSNTHDTLNRDDMNSICRATRLSCALGLMALVSSCAAISTYKACGVAGCPGDATITAAVQQLFAQHPAIEAPNLIDVQTLNHVVYLYGLVDTDLQRHLAESLARQAPGVTRVVNSIGLRNNSF